MSEKKKSKYNATQVMDELYKKGVSFDTHRSIDIEHAQPLGNKSWGKIDYLRQQGMRVIGWGPYIKRCGS